MVSLKSGLNLKEGEPNYDVKQLALECASKRMYPDILNYDRVVEVTGSFKTPMGCRSFLSTYEENGELIHEGRNNIGVISINLPRVAMRAQGDETEFYRLLDEVLAVSREGLDTRIARLQGVKARVAPILYMEGACGVRLNPDDDVSEIFKNGRASISLGYIGIHETVNALYGTADHSTTQKCCARKPLKWLNTCAKRPTAGKMKQATDSAYTARRVRTCVAVSVRSMRRNLASLQV